MKKPLAILRRVLVMGCVALFCIAAYAAIPNNDDPTTFLGPTAKGAYTSTINNTTAYSVLGEVGLKNFRAGGTLGLIIQDNQRVKFSAEYLVQKLTYAFFSGNTDQWVTQGAIGADYQYDLGYLGYMYNPQFDLSAWLSHAPSKGLSTVSGTFINNLGVSQAFSNNRRIAGSNALGFAPGVTFQPMPGTKAGFDLNYDNVRYDKNFAPNRDAKGLGGTVHVDQALSPDVKLGLLAAVRQPFNNYQANVTCANVPYMGSWLVGVDGAYTTGKNTLPNSYNVSVSFSYDLDQRYGARSGSLNNPVPGDLIAWTAKPAVYIPEVLAIPDEQVGGCIFGVPTFVGLIPDQTTAGGGVTVVLDTSAFFTGANLVFSIVTSAAPAPGNTLTFDTATGVLKIGRAHV